MNCFENLGCNRLFLVADLGFSLFCDLVCEGLCLVVSLDITLFEKPLHQSRSMFSTPSYCDLDVT